MGGWWAKFKVAGARGLWEGELEDGESDGCGREVGPGRLKHTCVCINILSPWTTTPVLPDGLS